MISHKAKSKAWAVARRGDGKVGLREVMGRKYISKFLLKEANDELPQISRGS